jgi:putative heme-binding domain-containing protein
LNEADRAALADIIDAPAPQQVTPLSAKPRPFVKEWSKDELRSLIDEKLTGRDFDHGRAMFAAANCFGCHRFSNEGGSVGPDLTSLAARFSPLDILESVVEPNKVISDQYTAIDVVTKDGRVVTGRLVNQGDGEIMINTNMLDPGANEDIKRSEIEELSLSSVSMMPTGLLNTLDEDEVLDLMAFLLSRGNPNDPMFAPHSSAAGN